MVLTKCNFSPHVGVNKVDPAILDLPDGKVSHDWGHAYIAVKYFNDKISLCDFWERLVCFLDHFKTTGLYYEVDFSHICVESR